MPWNDKYWDMIGNIYWTPRFLGLKSIPQKTWQVGEEVISIPRDRVENSNGPLYTRARKLSDLRTYLNGQEEVLNHFFNLAFSIMPDAIIARLLCRPLSIEDDGPFDSLGRDLALRYGWKPSENVTQPDGFFLTPRSLIAVELKLTSTSWPEQLAKYLALMVWEERASDRRTNLGLLFVVPEAALDAHWATLKLEGPKIDRDFIARLDTAKLPDRIKTLFSEFPAEICDAADRLRLNVVSWSWLAGALSSLERGLDASRAGEQTLLRLIAGFRAQIETHVGTGIRQDPHPVMIQEFVPSISLQREEDEL